MSRRARVPSANICKFQISRFRACPPRASCCFSRELYSIWCLIPYLLDGRLLKFHLILNELPSLNGELIRRNTPKKRKDKYGCSILVRRKDIRSTTDCWRMFLNKRSAWHKHYVFARRCGIMRVVLTWSRARSAFSRTITHLRHASPYEGMLALIRFLLVLAWNEATKWWPCHHLVASLVASLVGASLKVSSVTAEAFTRAEIYVLVRAIGHIHRWIPGRPLVTSWL